MSDKRVIDPEVFDRVRDERDALLLERDELAAALREIADMNSATAWQAVAIAKTALKRYEEQPKETKP